MELMLHLRIIYGNDNDDGFDMDGYRIVSDVWGWCVWKEEAFEVIEETFEAE